MLKEMSERTRSSKEGRISRAGNDVYSTAEGSGWGVVGRGGECHYSNLFKKASSPAAASQSHNETHRVRSSIISTPAFE